MQPTENIFKTARVEVPSPGLSQAVKELHRILTPGMAADTTEEMSFQLTFPQISPWLHVLLCVLERGP